MKILEDGCPQLEISQGQEEFQGGYVTVECVNKELRDWFESLDVVYGYDNGLVMHFTKSDHGDETHTARLTKPVPIVRDSFERVAKDLVSWGSTYPDDEVMAKLISRAENLLDKGEK